MTQPTPALHATFINSLEEIEAELWDAVCGENYPFLRHQFLLGLEQTNCTTAESGWRPCHLVLRDGTKTVAVAPLYLKSHSYGEYVFDWSWAEAWQRQGLEYYPKLVSAIPFTPATGPRLCVTKDESLKHEASDYEASIWETAAQAVKEFAKRHGLSSWHVLFLQQATSQQLLTAGMVQRTAVQFHWFNDNYRDFEDFLERFASRKRKSIRKERKRIVQQGLELKTLTGDCIGAQNWDIFHRFYQLTYAKRSGHGGYLSKAFFTDVASGMGDQVIMILAYHSGQPIAAALYFRSNDTLFGRYWGCEQEFDCLHFEACYYRGIEYCIEHGLKRFDPGAQGEHKIQRGFRPVLTFSNHWINDDTLASAVADFTVREKPHIQEYLEQTSALLPFKEQG